MTVNKEHVEKWVQALESGEYKKTKGALRARSGFDNGVHYCAIGVGIAVAEQDGFSMVYKDEDGILWNAWLDSIFAPPISREYYGFVSGNPFINVNGEFYTVMAANDNLDMSFWDIAQALRATYLKDED